MFVEESAVLVITENYLLFHTAETAAHFAPAFTSSADALPQPASPIVLAHARVYQICSFLEEIAGKVNFVRSGKRGDFEGVLENCDIVV